MGHEEVLFLVGRQILDLVGHAPAGHLAVRRFDEPEVVDAREGAQRADEADVRPLRGLDRANAAVVGGMNVPHLEAGTVAAEAAGSERGKAPLVGQLRERIGLIHELAELRASEEVPHHAAEGFRVDELRWRDVFESGIKKGHALLDHTLGARQAGAALVGKELAHGADAATAQVIDVVD